MRAQTMLGLPAGGAASNGTFTLIGGLADQAPPAAVPITMTITVTGTTNDPAAAITVNGTPAVVSGTTFSVDVRLSLGPNTLTAVATDALGNAISRSVAVYLDLPAVKKQPRFSIAVRGTVDDPAASVVVNGVSAATSSGTFSAQVPLVSGLNPLIAVATDPAGNSAETSIRVFVPPPDAPPARPTVGTVGAPLPTVTTAAAITFGGTKTRGTSIWINDRQVVALDDATTWTMTYALVEGDNELAVVTRDATGAESAPAVVNIIVDNLPPVLTVTVPAKTNFNPVAVTGTVDDSQTTVTINGIAATRNKRTFAVDIPLPTEGPNSVTVIATSPNGFVSTKPLTITRGTIPTIASIQPTDGMKLYAGTSATIQATATDKENDPMQCQIMIDGAVVVDWFAGASPPWVLTETQRGPHTIEVRVRDSFGGYASRQAEVFVGRAPIKPPNP